ncbi:MAG: hypothetical protein V5B40_14300 [Candidatus Accumulibacter meliphilus]|jgi:hypothetical protein|uniref:hypothetical protein n=1 Tax=Candidatus Accumulibacter meliphilus TaxID=2211374 RepID=UPI002FC2EB88
MVHLQLEQARQSRPWLDHTLTGTAKICACLDFLERLQAAGLLVLPALRPSPPRRCAPPWGCKPNLQKIPSARMPVWLISIIEIRTRHDRIQAASVSMTADAGVHQV